MRQDDSARQLQSGRFTASTVYQADPLARFLIERLSLSKHTLALASLAWSLVYLFVWPSIFGSMGSSGAYLGSLHDWHAQLLLLLVFPATCAFYLWQPDALAGVHQAILSRDGSRDEGRLYRRSTWWRLSLVLALAVVLFDVPKMAADRGSWWMTQNWLTIAGREASLSVAFYMVSMMAWRQLAATLEWRRLLDRPSRDTALRSVTRYGLSCAFLLALFGLRLSIEGIELPQRSGGITPDYYVKIAIYIAAGLACFFAPIGGVLRRGPRMSLDRLLTLLQLAGIMALPLLAFVVLKVALGG
ncbi:MAG: hypothetical protein WBB22_08295 [Anaerolineae bacterium]